MHECKILVSLMPLEPSTTSGLSLAFLMSFGLRDIVNEYYFKITCMYLRI